MQSGEERVVAGTVTGLVPSWGCMTGGEGVCGGTAGVYRNTCAGVGLGVVVGVGTEA